MSRPHYIRIERSTGVVTVFGPYPDEAAADLAMTESLLIDAECEEDCLECWANDEPPVDGEEQVVVDIEDVHHTG